jgi:hypothetical protein
MKGARGSAPVMIINSSRKNSICFPFLKSFVTELFLLHIHNTLFE